MLTLGAGVGPYMRDPLIFPTSVNRIETFRPVRNLKQYVCENSSVITLMALSDTVSGGSVW